MCYGDNCEGQIGVFNTFFYPEILSDNVHFQNSAQLIEVLTQADIKFQMQVSGNAINVYDK